MTHKRHATVEVDLFHQPVTVVWDIEAEGLARFVKQKWGIADFPDDLHTGAGLYTSFMIYGRLTGLIALDSKFEGTPYDYSVLAHECLHAAFHLLRKRGLRYGKQSEEAFTYFTDFLIEKLATKMLAVESRIAKLES